MPRVLVVEDDDDVREAVYDAAVDLGYVALACACATDALQVLAREDIGVVVTDVRMPGLDGLGLCRRILDNYPDVPVVIMTAYGDVPTITAAMRADAVDFLRKPFTRAELARILERAFSRARASGVSRLKESTVLTPLVTLVGSSKAMRSLEEQVRRCAFSDSPVLITGESGTGKELIANALHDHGRRGGRPFVAVNCAAVPRGILASELFGHSKGAFTGAEASRRGLFQQAHGGTLFLDEIGAMPLDLQPSLLRALEASAVRPVGGTREESIDVRILAATNSSLEDEVRAGAFRQELLFRLSVLRIHAPPLRERGGDVIELAEHFLNELAARAGKAPPTLSGETARLLLAHPWPGNVRELENCMYAAFTLCTGDTIEVEHLPEWLDLQPGPGPASSASGEHSLEAVERQHIERVLRAVGGNKAEAARRLGIDRTTLYRKLARLGLTDRAISR